MAKAVSSRFAVLKIEDDEEVANPQQATDWKSIPKKSQKQKKHENSKQQLQKSMPKLPTGMAAPVKKNKKKKKNQESSAPLDAAAEGGDKKGAAADDKAKQEKQWEQQDDEQYTDELQKVLLLSRQEFERDQTPTADQPQNGHSAKNGDVSTGVSELGSPTKKASKKKAKKKDKLGLLSDSDAAQSKASEDGSGVFGLVTADVQKIIVKERRQQDLKENVQLEAALRQRFQHEIDTRDEELAKLRAERDKTKADYAEVKKRNKQLCFILAQGEMKEKSELVAQVDELTQLKDELTKEVGQLTSALQKETSEVHKLKEELRKRAAHH